MKWMVPINNLTTQQKNILSKVFDSNDLINTYWIRGYAGTGKTIVLTHAIEKIVSKTRGKSIAFLTYTHALKDLVSSGLSEKALSRVQYRYNRWF